MTIDRETLMGALGLQPRESAGSRFFWSLGLTLGGAVIGAGIALLLAPKAGTELRKDLVREAKAMIGPKDGHQVGYDESSERVGAGDGAGV